MELYSIHDMNIRWFFFLSIFCGSSNLFLVLFFSSKVLDRSSESIHCLHLVSPVGKRSKMFGKAFSC